MGHRSTTRDPPFYLLAAPVRLLGPSLGMPAVSLLISATCLLLSLWIVYRLLGTRSALVATAALSLVAFSTGAASFVNPVSSSIAGYPLLLSVVALWGSRPATSVCSPSRRPR